MKTIRVAFGSLSLFSLADNKKVSVYDSHGRLLGSGLDVCDCLLTDCPGCHFPCPKCSSGKCGYECRRERKYQYESVEIDGVPNSTKHNKHIVK